ncbi:unnamed protein product [Chironomus riparius]|uniref:Uncharacterized protein n=1 Tax=Chironomus riparius TaxID=315576 RepID=A0A9N9RL49_9DIPT|nr:unnamed protein product [Chironomus riparius]
MSVNIVDTFGNLSTHNLEFVSVESMDELLETSMIFVDETPFNNFDRLPEELSQHNEPDLGEESDLHTSLTELRKFIDERERLKSFDTWNIPHISKHSLAETGFYFLRQPDVVKCFFCEIEIESWTVFDVVVNEHRRWSPSCLFMRGFPTRNTEISKSRSQA